MLGRRHRNSVTEEGRRNTGRTWTEDGKRRQSFQLLFINSTVVSIEETKEPRVSLASDTAICRRKYKPYPTLNHSWGIPFSFLERSNLKIYSQTISCAFLVPSLPKVSGRERG
jgi:hypothetical protein